MQVNSRFQHAFSEFVAATYGEAAKSIEYERLSLLYEEVFSALLALLATENITYDEFIVRELQDWVTPSDIESEPMLPVEYEFRHLYMNKGYKYSFLVLCLQSQLPAVDISALLIQACYKILQGTPSWYGNITHFLEFLSEYHNQDAVPLVSTVLSLLTEEWYTQDLVFALQQLLDSNPGPSSIGLQQNLSQLESRIEMQLRSR